MSKNTIPEALKKFLLEVNAHTPVYIAQEIRDIFEETVRTYTLPKLHLPVIENRYFKTENNEIPIRIYHPNPQKKLPVSFYFHGGGHVCGSIETHDSICRRIADASETLIISVGYRLAPEHPYPAGLLDCIAAYEQRNQLLNNLHADTNKVFLIGDSAGGNLALSVCNYMKEHRDTNIKGLALIYPSVDFSMNYDSFERNGEGFLLTREKVKWYFNTYFLNGGDRVKASPINFKQLKSFPPIYIAAAELDPLFDEAIVFAEKIKNLGIPIKLEKFKGMIHAFAQLETLVPGQVSQLVKSISHFIKSVMKPDQP